MEEDGLFPFHQGNRPDGGGGGIPQVQRQAKEGETPDRDLIQIAQIFDVMMFPLAQQLMVGQIHNIKIRRLVVKAIHLDPLVQHPSHGIHMDADNGVSVSRGSPEAVLKAYMEELRRRGFKPIRDWEK